MDDLYAIQANEYNTPTMCNLGDVTPMLFLECRVK